MKRILLLLLLVSLLVNAEAQSVDAIKNLYIIGQKQKAREDLDKAMANSKFTAKPEAYLLKTMIYAGLATDEGIKGTAQGLELTKEAEAAFAKYKEMQPDLALVKDPVYQNGPVNLYSSLFSIGYKNYDKKEWQPAYETFKKV